MFESCSGLTNLDVSNFNTSNVTNMSYMFCTCSGLTNLDLSNFITSNVTNMSAMFRYCKSLTNLDIRKFGFTKVTNYSGMFDEVPIDCLIIVKDETAKEWITSKFTTLTNVKTVAELEEV
jgi:surface protein